MEQIFCPCNAHTYIYTLLLHKFRTPFSESILIALRLPSSSKEMINYFGVRSSLTRPYSHQKMMVQTWQPKVTFHLQHNHTYAECITTNIYIHTYIHRQAQTQIFPVCCRGRLYGVERGGRKSSPPVFTFPKEAAEKMAK